MKETVELDWDRAYSIISKGNNEEFQEILGGNPQLLTKFFEILISKLVRRNNGIVKLNNLPNKDAAKAYSILNPSLLAEVSLERIKEIVKKVPYLPNRLKSQRNKIKNLLLVSLFSEPSVVPGLEVYQNGVTLTPKNIKFKLQSNNENLLKAIELGAGFSQASCDENSWFGQILSYTYITSEEDYKWENLCKDHEPLKRLHVLLSTIVEKKLYIAEDNLKDMMLLHCFVATSHKGYDCKKDDPELIYSQGVLNSLEYMMDQIYKSIVSKVNTEAEIPKGPTNVPSNIRNSTKKSKSFYSKNAIYGIERVKTR